MEVIQDCIMTANTAPSGANLQPWHFSIVVNPEMKQKIRTAAEKVEIEFYKDKISDQWRQDLEFLKVNTEKPFLTEAPCLIVIFKENYRYLENGAQAPNYYVTESACLATGLLINALRNAGYSSLTYTPAPMSFLRDILGRGKNETPVMVLAVGKKDPSYNLPPIKRKSFEQIADIF